MKCTQTTSWFGHFIGEKPSLGMQGPITPRGILYLSNLGMPKGGGRISDEQPPPEIPRDHGWIGAEDYPGGVPVGLEDGDCWFCGEPFDVEEDDCRFCEIFFEDSGGLIRSMDVPLCTPCGERLTAESPHDEAVRGPSVIFRVMYNDS